jgi:hypothetical protein
MKNNPKIFNKSYKISRSGKIYPKVRSWIPLWCQWLADRIKADKKIGHPITFVTTDAPTGSTKLMAMATFAEYIDKHQNQLIIIHQTNLKDQHRSDIPDLIEQGWLTKKVQVHTYQKIRSLIEKDFNGADLSDDDQRLLNFIQKVEIIYLDEIHTYSKDKDVLSLPKIIKYLSSHSLKVACGVTATSKHCEGWYRLIETQMGIDFAQAYYERKYTYKKIDAARDGVITPPEMIFVNTSLELDLEIGEFVESRAELLEKTAKQLADMAQIKWSKNIKDENPKSLKEQAKVCDVEAQRLREHLDEFINNRIKESIFILNQPQQQGYPALVYVPLQKDAASFKKFYIKTKKKLRHKFECLEWHGTSDDYFANNTESKEIQKRLQDPNDPLKTVVLVGMWREGTDLQNLNQVHDCSYKPDNMDRTDQLKGRLRNGGKYFAYLDAINTKTLIDIHKKNLQDSFGNDHDDKWFQAAQAALEASQFDDEPEQYGDIKGQDDYSELDSNINENLENLFGISNIPTIVGWVKKVHKGDTTCVTISSASLMDPDNDVAKLTETMKLENFFRLLNAS